MHFISCSSYAWAIKSACSLTVCVPSETGKKNNLIRNNPAKNKYQIRKSIKKTFFFPYLPDESINHDVDYGLVSSKDALGYFTTIWLSYLLKILWYFLNIMGLAQNLLIVIKPKQDKVLMHRLYLTLSKLSCREETSFALCNVVAWTLTLVMGNKMFFVRF